MGAVIGFAEADEFVTIRASLPDYYKNKIGNQQQNQYYACNFGDWREEKIKQYKHT